MRGPISPGSENGKHRPLVLGILLDRQRHLIQIVMAKRFKGWVEENHLIAERLETFVFFSGVHESFGDDLRKRPNILPPRQNCGQ